MAGSCARVQHGGWVHGTVYGAVCTVCVSLCTLAGPQRDTLHFFNALLYTHSSAMMRPFATLTQRAIGTPCQVSQRWTRAGVSTTRSALGPRGASFGIHADEPVQFLTDPGGSLPWYYFFLKTQLIT